MSGNLLTVVQILFFGMGAYYFFRHSRKKKVSGLTFEDNFLEMERLEDLWDVHLTEPLAEQTRPKRIEEIVGQEKAIRALRAALCGPNPQHVLIYGPPGVGKTAAARLILEEAKKRGASPFLQGAKFIELDATTLRFDERNIADPLLGSVHDPIYQGAGAFGHAGIPQPRPGAVCEAHGGVLFLDEIGELHPVQMNRLLKILEDRVARFQSSYYSRRDKAIPPYIHQIFQKGLPADFRLIGATTRSPEEIPDALRSRCTEIFFEPLQQDALAQIAENALKKTGLAYEAELGGRIAVYAQGGRDAVNIVQSLTALAWLEEKKRITEADLKGVIQMGKYQPLCGQSIPEQPQVGVVNGLGVQQNGGGVLLTVEAVMKKGKSGLTVTGILEEEELRGRARSYKKKSSARTAAEIALTVLEQFGFSREAYAVHLHFAGGIPVDGPSAGLAMFLAVYSAFTGAPVPQEIALTGEITLHGNILPVGGVEEKIRAAKAAGAKRVFIPQENAKEDDQKIEIEVIPVTEVREVLERVFLPCETLFEGRELLEGKEIG